MLKTIDGETRLMGVLGEDIAYTQSPCLHNASARRLGINAAYVAVPLPAVQVKPFLDAAWHMGALGFSVTTPHKGLVATLVPGCRLKSVNTLYRGSSWWEAASTDGEGFARGILRMERTLASFTDIVLLGTGGAALAVVAYLAGLASLPRLQVFRRKPDRDDELRTLLPAGAPVTFHELTPANLGGALRGKGPDTLLVQATSAPQRGDDLRDLVPALGDFAGAVTDLVYGKPSALYFAAIARDLTAQDGEAMLIEQARLAQKLWWGKAASYDDLAAALRGK